MKCLICDSGWVRYEHLDVNDCTDECNDPCTVMICNEEDCVGDVTA